jgi:uncharacterized membrane protein
MFTNVRSDAQRIADQSSFIGTAEIHLMPTEILFFQCFPRRRSYAARPMQEKRIHQIFVVSVLAKGIHALIEIAGGAALYLISTETIVRTIQRYSYDELIEDRNDWIATHLLQFAQNFSVAEHHFYAFYLLSHGLIKSVLVIGLLREKLWAYPASFAVFGAFIAYQLYRYTFTHDIGLILLSIFDAFVIYLAVHEYRLLRRHLPTH